MRSKDLLDKLVQKRLSHVLKKVGEDSRATFEQNFFQLASTIIQEQLPKLNDYIIGFQLVDKSADNSTAFGLAGFRLKTLVFVPFFFNNGKITGYEILYLPKQNMFLPSTEPWVANLRNKNEPLLGTPTNEYRHLYTASYPNLLPLRRPIMGLSGATTTKYSNLLEKGFKKTKLGKILPEVIKNKKMATALISIVDKYPSFISPIIDHYGEGIFKSAIEAAQAPAPYVSNVCIPVSVKEAQRKLKVYNSIANDYMELSPDEVDTIKRQGYMVKDAREDSEISPVIPYISHELFFPINTSGVYTVLDNEINPKDYVFVKVDKDWMVFDTDKTNVAPTVTVIHPDMCPSVDGSPRSSGRISPNNLFAIKIHPVAEFNKFIDSLPTVELEELLSGNIIRTLINKAPNDVREQITKDRYIYHVVLIDASGSTVSLVYNKEDTGWELERFVDIYQGNGKRLHVRKVDGKTNVILPKKCKAFLWEGYSSDRLNILDPVTFLDIMGKTAHLVKIYRDNGDFIIGDERVTKLGALEKLMREYNVREKTALTMLRTALREKVARYWVKTADTFKVRQTDSPKPWFIEAPTSEFAPGYRATYPNEVEYIVPGIKRPQAVVNIMEPPPKNVIQTLSRIAETNNGEVFDTGLIAGLLHTTQDDEMIERYIPRILKAVDALGRILFNLYRHQDTLKERYGEDDYIQIVDNIKTNFENLGDLAVDLVQQKIDPYLKGKALTDTERGDDFELE